MSKINQIENALRELDGGAFQKLCDAYLHKRGYEPVNALGSVTGSNKVRQGTPDTFVPLPNGKYVFAEYTTQQERLLAKLESDLAKCLDEANSGIPRAKIQEVVFCHTSQLKPGDHSALVEQCQRVGVNLNVFGISAIAYDLYQKYPLLARDYLGVEVDTGQILSAEDFVSEYEKNKLVTSLRTQFRFREDELLQMLSTLQEKDLVIVTGPPGVGKSRLALECCRRFAKEHSNYDVRCILHRGQDLFEDLKDHFSEPRQYLIFVDDANRVSRFEYVAQLLTSVPKGAVLRIIATVRDYAVAKIAQIAEKYASATEVRLEPFKDEQIRELVREEYGIKNEHYLERIAQIAKGNPRLATMAARVACAHNTLQSINDVTALYDVYFRSITQDLQQLAEPMLLKVATIVAFFRTVDRSNDTLMGEISQAFDISTGSFWEAATKLHDIEVLDMHENEVVRISDQVLGTYLFFLCFFKEKSLDFGVLLSSFFPAQRGNLVDAIHPVLDAFDSKSIIEIMRPHVDRCWSEFERSDDHNGLLDLMSAFWFVKETDTLLRLQEWIQALEPESVDEEEFVFEPRQGVQSPSVLSILGIFRNSTAANVKIAVGLLLDYAGKKPPELPSILHTLTETFGFQHTDSVYVFSVQRAVVDVLLARASGEDTLAKRIFLATARAYLQTHFSGVYASGRRAFSMIDFTLRSSPEVRGIRDDIWQAVFAMYDDTKLRDEVLDVIRKYTDSVYKASHEIVAEDMPFVVAFMDSKLDVESYEHCLVVQDYLTFLEQCEVAFNAQLRQRFRCEAYRISETLTEDFSDYIDSGIDHDAFREVKKQHIAEFCRSYDLVDYQRFIRHCGEIQRALKGNHRDWVFNDGLEMAFVVLAKRDDGLYLEVMKRYLGQGDPLHLRSFSLVESLVEHLGPDGTYNLLRDLGHATNHWMAMFFRCLKQPDIKQEHVERLLDFYEHAEPEALLYGTDFLLTYHVRERRIFPLVTRIVLDRKAKAPNCISALSMLFNPHSEANKILVELYESDIGPLKQAYIALSTRGRYEDYDGRAFLQILDADPAFLTEYIDARYASAKYPSRYDDSRNYAFLWERDDYRAIGARLIEHVYNRERNRGSHRHDYLLAFIQGDNTEVQPSIAERQDEVIRELIDQRHAEMDFMRFLFRLIAEFPAERRRPLLAHFLRLNKEFELFKVLPLEPNHWSWGGSAVPMCQKRVEYFESLLPLLDTADLLEHKQHVEQHIEWIRSEIEREKKCDFMDID